MTKIGAKYPFKNPEQIKKILQRKKRSLNKQCRRISKTDQTRFGSEVETIPAVSIYDDFVPVDHNLDTSVQQTPIDHTYRKQEHDNWVTVFGFSPGSISQILKQFQKYGQIVRYKMGEGNWVHIEYLTRLEAQNALAKNGIKIDKNLMIGVIPFTDQVSRCHKY